MAHWKPYHVLLVILISIQVAPGYRLAKANAPLAIPMQSSGNVAEIVSTLTSPTIDGAIDEIWQSANRYDLTNQLLGDSPLASSNLSASFRSLYDANKLYFLIEVVDDVKINDSEENPNFDDTVEIYLDGNFSRGLAYDNLDDRVTLFRWDDSEPHASSLSPPLPNGLESAIVDTSTGYRVEVAFPFSQIRIKPMPGYQFGLDVHALDDDDGGDKDNKLAWNGTEDDVWQNPSLMGIGRLGPPPEPPLIAEISGTLDTPTIDGTIDSTWLSAATYPIQKLVVGTESVAAPDLAGSFRALHDSINLYLLVEVIDDSLNNDSTTIFHDDVVDIYLDGNKSRGDAYDGVDDRQIWFRWNDSTPHAGAESAPVPLGIEHLSVLTGNGYRTEISIPLNQAGIAYAEGVEFGFDVHIHDDDQGGNRDHKIAWNAWTDYAWTKPTLMGLGRLGAMPIPNRRPVANDDLASTANTQVLQGSNLLANDSDPDGDSLTISTTPVSAPSHGTLVINPDGTFRYTPDTNFVGDDSFTYQISDGRGGSDTAEVII
ncbi:MAG: sugar-binding protein, partial [Chloroflexota bacterium]